MEEFQEMVLGFAFCKEFSTGPHVLLMRKMRPEWQYGLLNGIGGHKEPSDFSWRDAMKRESVEEVGLELEWEYYAKLKAPSYELRAFRTFLDFSTAFNIKAQTDEEVNWVPLLELYPGQNGFVSQDLQYLIPLGFFNELKYSSVVFEQI